MSKPLLAHAKVSAESLAVFYQCIAKANWKILKLSQHFIVDILSTWILKAGYGYFQCPWVSFVLIDEFSVRVWKLLQGLVSHELSTFDLFLTRKMVILSKRHKPDKFESRNSLNLALPIFKVFFEFCWMWIFARIKLPWNSCSI